MSRVEGIGDCWHSHKKMGVGHPREADVVEMKCAPGSFANHLRMGMPFEKHDGPFTTTRTIRIDENSNLAREPIHQNIQMTTISGDGYCLRSMRHIQLGGRRKLNRIILDPKESAGHLLAFFHVATAVPPQVDDQRLCRRIKGLNLWHESIPAGVISPRHHRGHRNDWYIHSLFGLREVGPNIRREIFSDLSLSRLRSANKIKWVTGHVQMAIWDLAKLVSNHLADLLGGELRPLNGPQLRERGLKRGTVDRPARIRSLKCLFQCI